MARTIGCVYFVTSPFRGGLAVKIGWTTNPWVRMAAFQSGNPEPLELFALVTIEAGDARGGTGPASLEKELHRRFNGSRLTGEWFLFSEEIRDYVEKYARRAA